MIYYSTEEIRIEEGVFIKHLDGFYSFQFSFDELVVFEEINASVLEEFDLRTEEFVGATFEVTYKEIINDLDDDDFLIFRIIELKLV